MSTGGVEDTLISSRIFCNTGNAHIRIPHPINNRGVLHDPVTLNTFLEYSGAGLRILGWLGVCQIRSPGAQQIGFVVWIIGGLLLIAWGITRKRGRSCSSTR